ncbi:MAG: type II toxin-antitoxin system VapC family toxin [Actinomycetota bacterium]|nr:type II toxin-antitoxin system VapC family toxin [Actinomycetota bacterium]
MLLPDVNVCICAMRRDAEHHVPLSQWLSARLTGEEPVGISELVLSSLVRITTNHRIFGQPSTPEQAMDFCAALRAAPTAVAVRAGPRHWSIFERLMTQTRARANDVPDAYLAALALEQGATWVTRDRGFARFPGLRVQDPLGAGPV